MDFSLASSIASFIRELQLAASAPQSTVEGRIQTLLTAALSLLDQACPGATLRATRTSGRPAQLAAQFLRLAQAHCRDRWSLTDYARALHVSAGHLRATFVRVKGAPPVRLIHNCLIREAKRLLIGSSLPISAIALSRWSLVSRMRRTSRACFVPRAACHRNSTASLSGRMHQPSSPPPWNEWNTRAALLFDRFRLHQAEAPCQLAPADRPRYPAGAGVSAHPPGAHPLGVLAWAGANHPRACAEARHEHHAGARGAAEAHRGAGARAVAHSIRAGAGAVYNAGADRAALGALRALHGRALRRRATATHQQALEAIRARRAAAAEEEAIVADIRATSERYQKCRRDHAEAFAEAARAAEQ